MADAVYDTRNNKETRSDDLARRIVLLHAAYRACQEEMNALLVQTRDTVNKDRAD